MSCLIKAQSGALATALELAVLPVTEKQAKRTPVLGAVRLAADGNGACTVTITNLAATVSISVKAEGEGEMALPCERLADLADAFPAGAEITIAADDNTATVSFGKSRFKLPLFPIPDLPAPYLIGEETGHVSLDAGIARNLFSRTAFAASVETTRYYLNGIFLHSAEGALVATASDGHRLARVMTATSSTLSAGRSLIVPRELLKPIHRLLGKAPGNVELRRDARLFSIEGAAFQIVGRLIDAEYPDTTRIIPAGYPNAATCSRAGLIKALERFAAAAGPQDSAHVVTLRWNGADLHLSAPNDSSDCLGAETTGEAETTIQVRYLGELLEEAMRGDAVMIAAGKPGGPVIFTDPNDASFLSLQMPIQPRSS